MQNSKDSFFIALRDRLAALDPSRTVTVLGVTRPAVLVAENELADAAPALPEAFYIMWASAGAVAGAERLDYPLLQMSCEITYWTQGSADLSGQDRGRTLADLDDELLSVTRPPRAVLKDFSQTPAVDLGANIFWTRPALSPVVQDGSKLIRTAKLEVFTHVEVAQ